MAEPAGHVNDSGQENDAAFAEIIAGSSSAIQELARAVRDLVYEVLPQTVEVVWPRQGSVGTHRLARDRAARSSSAPRLMWLGCGRLHVGPSETDASNAQPAGARRVAGTSVTF
jgi:hypothetical protein